MKYPFKSLLLAATVLAAASCAKDDTQSGGEETAGPVIVNASPAAIGGEIILKLKTEASGIVEKSRAQGVSKGSGIDEIDRHLNTVTPYVSNGSSRTAGVSKNAPAGKACTSGITPNTTRRSRRARWPACSLRARTSKSSNTRWPPKLRTTAARHLPPPGRRASPAPSQTRCATSPSRSTRANARSRCNGTTTTRETSSRRRASWAPTPTYTPPGSSRRAIPT